MSFVIIWIMCSKLLRPTKYLATSTVAIYLITRV